jgi:hypothetical protein
MLKPDEGEVNAEEQAAVSHGKSPHAYACTTPILDTVTVFTPLLPIGPSLEHQFA